MYRRVPFIYFVLAASLLITAISSVTNAIDGLNPLAGYVTGWFNNSTVTVVNATYNSSEVDYLVTLKENGSRVCTAANGVCNGTGSGSSNITFSNGTSGWWGRFTNSTNLAADGVVCAAGYGISALTNNSQCTQFETPASAAATYYPLTNPSNYLSSVPTINITGVNVTNGSTHTLSIRVSDGNTFNVTFDDTTGGGGAQNITFNTTYTQYGFTYMENATQIGTNSLLQKQNATTVFVNNTLNTTYLVQNNFSSPYAFQTQFTKCWESELGQANTAGSAQVNSPWGLQTISAGAVVATAGGGDDHPLIISLRDSTTANGGVIALLSSVTAGVFTPKAGDELRAIVRFSSGKPGVVTGRIGFSDTQSITAPTDGCYLEMNATATNIAQFVCANAGTRTPNATTLAFSNATWYGVSISYINTTAANATIWGDTGTVLLSVGLRSGINTAASNPQLIVTQSTTDAAATILDLDYIGFCRQYKPQRAWSYGQ